MKSKSLCSALLAVLMLTMAIMAGCAGKTATPAGPAANANGQGQEGAALQKITVAEATRGEYWLPVYLASQLGYFRDEGLDVKFVTYKDGPLALLGLVGGDAQFCIIGFEPVLRAYEQGKKTKVILTTTYNQPYMFATRKGINRIADLKGKVVFAGMPGSAPYAFARAVLKSAGLNPDKDVSFANLEYGAEVAALSKGEIDGCYVRASKYPEFTAIGANILVDATDPAQHRKIYGSERYEAMVVQVTDSYIKTSPQTVQKFTNAVAKAMRWQTEHSSAEIAVKVAKLFPGRKIDARLIDTVKRSLSPDGYFTQEGYATVERFCRDVGIITKPVPFAEVIDQSFIKKANETLGR